MLHVFSSRNKIITLFSTVLMTSILSSVIIALMFYNTHKEIMAQIITMPSQGNNTTNTTTISYLTYENPTYAIRIQYPSDWEKIEFNQIGNSVNLVVIFRSLPENSLDIKLENLVIEVGNLPFKNIPLGEVIKANINNLKKSLTDFELNESTTITIAGGNRAHKIVYTYREEQENNEQAKIMQVLMIKSDKAYLITYTAEQRKYDSYLPIIEKMIDSLRIKTHDDAFPV
jgi:hypothetical protein